MKGQILGMDVQSCKDRTGRQLLRTGLHVAYKPSTGFRRGGVQSGGGYEGKDFVFNQFANYECANFVITEAIWPRLPATLDCLPEERLWEDAC